MKYGSFAALFSILALSAGCGAAPDASDDSAEARASESALSDTGDLTAAQAKQALKLVDDICGDTWCEGDYDFKFRALKCSYHAGTCTLTMQLFPVGGHGSYWRSCKTSDLHRYADLVVSGTYPTLNQSYYDALTMCIGRIEKSLPR